MAITVLKSYAFQCVHLKTWDPDQLKVVGEATSVQNRINGEWGQKEMNGMICEGKSMI